MITHLLAIAIGPVQEFIAAARRTRDLWFGSLLLSEISKATALAVHEEVHGRGGGLIFPAPSDHANPEELQPYPRSSLNVANIIVAAVGNADPREVAQAARKAAEGRWLDFLGPSFRNNSCVIDESIWNDQVDDVIEFYAAWMPLSGPDEYKDARAKLMRLLAGRKNCRDFRPAKGRAGVFKSSLDGLRESVLTDPKTWPPELHRRLRVRKGEHLDVVGLVKRTWRPPDNEDRYPSVSRVAADPWIRGLIKTRGEQVLVPIRTACRDLDTPMIHELDIDRHPHYKSFPYEGTAVFRTRHHELQEETTPSEDDLNRLSTLTKELCELVRIADEPNPYLAVLAADGDRMGEAISKLGSADEHRKFSRQLSKFAAAAQKIVHDHNGVLVYSGGDDVLAFVPVDRCLQCARALHDAFGGLMQDWTARTGAQLTLSVGVAIAHFMENLEDLLNYGRAAEKHAKKPHGCHSHGERRNGLAVHLHKRSGGPVSVRAQWTDRPEDGLDGHVLELASLLNQQAISGRVAYDLHRIADVYDDWREATVADAVRRDALRVIAAKQPRGESRMDEVRKLISSEVSSAGTLRRLADRLLIARQIATAIRQAAGRPLPAEVST